MAGSGFPKKDTSEITSFTVDERSGVNEMPSVTKLLNRKKLENFKGSDLPAPPTPPPIPEMPQAAPSLETWSSPPTSPSGPMPTLELHIGESSQNASSSSAPSIQLEPPTTETQTPAVLELSVAPPVAAEIPAPSLAAQPGSGAAKPKIRKQTERHGAASNLAHWTREDLTKSRDPLAQSVIEALNRGATGALYLSVEAPAPGATPVFKATAECQAQLKANYWQGLLWDPKVVPELWNFLATKGCVELSPPGTVTYIKSNRNVARSAFGVSADEWLLLIRVGGERSLRGILCVLSKKTMVPDLQAVLQALNAPAPTKSA